MAVRLEQIYQDVILDHYKHPQHRGLREPFGAQVHHVNPICGDEVTLRVALSDDGEHVVDVSYDGQVWTRKTFWDAGEKTNFWRCCLRRVR